LKREDLFYEKTFLNESVFDSFVDQKNIEILSEIIKYLAIKEEKIVPAIPGYNEDYQDEKSGSCCHESVTWTVTATKWVEGTPAIKYYSMNSKIQTLINCIEKMDENNIKEINLIITSLSIKEIKMAFKKY